MYAEYIHVSMYLVICANNPELDNHNHNEEYLCTFCRIYLEKMVKLSFVLISSNNVSKCAKNTAWKTLNASRLAFQSYNFY